MDLPDQKQLNELIFLKQEHEDLDRIIVKLTTGSEIIDQWTLRRLKKRKLILKDQITNLESQIYPDIIA